MDETTAWARLNGAIETCRACPRLVAWREKVAREKRRAFREEPYWGRPVPGYGDRGARLLILGLAPAAHGANRTGRVFSGDSSGRTLIPAMHRAGLANQPVSEGRGDGLVLRDAYLSAVCRCAPPQNRPTAEELDRCRPFLAGELELLTNLRVVLALGRLAFDGFLRLLREQGHSLPRIPFGHGTVHRLPAPLPVLVASYHPSRQNTQTGRLTEEMLDRVFARVRDEVARCGDHPR